MAVEWNNEVRDLFFWERQNPAQPWDIQILRGLVDERVVYTNRLKGEIIDPTGVVLCSGDASFTIDLDPRVFVLDNIEVVAEGEPYRLRLVDRNTEIWLFALNVEGLDLATLEAPAQFTFTLEA